MSRIALGLDDIGLALRLQEILEAAGHTVTWDGALAAGPRAGQTHDVVILSADGNPAQVGERVRAWRAGDPPAIIMVAESPAAAQLAGTLGTAVVSARGIDTEIGPAIGQAEKLRHAAEMSPETARRALGIDSGDADARRIAAAARRANIDVVREALRPHQHHYVATDDGVVAALRDDRALDVPEIELTRLCSGAATVARVLAAPGMDQLLAARAMWALASLRAIRFSPEPPDRATAARRSVAEMRDHIRARQRRLARASCYDVLEVVRGSGLGHVNDAYRRLTLRYAPDRLAALDLGELTSLVAPMWDQIVQSEELLRDEGSRGRYNQMLASRPRESLTSWAAGEMDFESGEAHFARGQAALVAGDAFRAVSEMAAACRACPDFPDYDVSLAWARFRAEQARATDRDQAAARERAAAEGVLAGRRPWPRSLVALAMLCAATQDADAARWHLGEALACDPDLPAARQLLNRLGRR